MLSSKEHNRYQRHIQLPEVGVEGQQKLKQAKVLVIGSGGLGCPILQYLTAAGIGTIGIADGDTVSYSNLQRQILFDAADVGKPKVEAAVEKLQKQNELVKFNQYGEYLTRENILEIVNEYDIIVDGTDNFETRYLVGDATLILNKPLVFGSIFRFEGQVSVFNLEQGPSYRCLFPNPPEEGEVPNCAEVGVLGVLPGVIGAQMANEVIKLILGIGEPLSGRLLITDLLNNKSLSMKVSRIEENFSRTDLEPNYSFACGYNDGDDISPIELARLIENGRDELDLIDVREPFEFDLCKIEDSISIPLGELVSRSTEISKDRTKVFICHHGIRSRRAMDWLSKNGIQNMLILKGGIDAWALEVDSKMERY